MAAILTCRPSNPACQKVGFKRYLNPQRCAYGPCPPANGLPHFEQLVYPQWLHDLQQGKEVTAKPAGDWKVIEAAWGRAEVVSAQPYPWRGLH